MLYFFLVRPVVVIKTTLVEFVAPHQKLASLWVMFVLPPEKLVAKVVLKLMCLALSPLERYFDPLPGQFWIDLMKR